MKKTILHKISALILSLVCIVSVLNTGAFAAANINSGLTMSVKSGCYIYSKNVATAPYRVAYLNFGQDVSVVNKGSEWTTINYGGATRYIKTANINNKIYMVVKTGVLVSPGAYAASSSKNYGYVHYGDNVTYLETVSNSSGAKFVHCIIPVTYNSNGSVKSKNVDGYIKYANVSDQSVMKIINAGSNVYSYGYGSGSTEAQKKSTGYLYSGTLVELIASNDAWCKIKYNGAYYYISPKRLSSYKLQVCTKSVKQTAEPNPNSKVLHYAYWNGSFTVLNVYESKTYGTYYYCKLSGDYGFIRRASSSGTVYAGYNTKMHTTAKTSMYTTTSSSSAVIATLPSFTTITVGYSNSSWTAVSYNGKNGYVSTKKLVYPEYNISGNYYTSAYKLYKNTPGGTLNEKISLLALNEGYGYAYVKTSSGSKYWVKSASIKALKSEKYMYTTAPGVTLHKSADAKSDSVFVRYMTELEVYDTSVSPTGSWTKVKYNGGIYYLWQNKNDKLLTDKPSTFTYKSDNEMAQNVIDKAMELYNLPTKYVSSGSSGKPDSDGKYGFDCSGFVTYVLESVMKKYVPTYDLYASADALYKTRAIYNVGYTSEFSTKKVSLDSIKPGDILFFDLKDGVDGEAGSGVCDHCAIYLGNGEFIHSSRSWETGLFIMPLSGIYKTELLEVRRFIPDTIVQINKTMRTTSTINIYPQKTQDGGPMDRLAKGTAVTVLFTDNTSWAYVKYDGDKKGFVSTKYLTNT